MQVCAMLKLGTGRAVTNHPHFENEWLRRRTVDTYQVNWQVGSVGNIYSVYRFMVFTVLHNSSP